MAPAATGVAIDVPLIFSVPHVSPLATSASVKGFALMMLSPGDTTSGFIRPSRVGPPEVKDAKFSCRVSTRGIGPRTPTLRPPYASTIAASHVPSLCGILSTGIVDVVPSKPEPDMNGIGPLR